MEFTIRMLVVIVLIVIAFVVFVALISMWGGESSGMLKGRTWRGVTTWWLPSSACTICPIR